MAESSDSEGEGEKGLNVSGVSYTSRPSSNMCGGAVWYYSDVIRILLCLSYRTVRGVRFRPDSVRTRWTPTLHPM